MHVRIKAHIDPTDALRLFKSLAKKIPPKTGDTVLYYVHVGVRNELWWGKFHWGNCRFTSSSDDSCSRLGCMGGIAGHQHRDKPYICAIRCKQLMMATMSLEEALVYAL